MKQYIASSSSADKIAESQKIKEGIEVIEIESDEDSTYLPITNEKGKNIMTNDVHSNDPTKGLPFEVIEIESDEDSTDLPLANEKGKEVMTEACDGHSNDSTEILVLKGLVMDEQEDDVPGILKEYKKFKKFDIVQDCLDHRFYKIDSSWVKQQSRDWAKRIQEEWKILEKNLPDTIFVRAYEERMDLLRAVILGAQGTPYHDGLFFFDILFPPNYPDSPPVVYYHSHGLRLNPNLYDDGYVCLSLLSTWHTENENEKWQPNLSNMLQVLVSIQGLVLNAEPYFNEPGFEDSSLTTEGQTTSLLYSEDTFLLSLHSMIYTMRKAPKHFENLVAGHFMTYAADILEACKAYITGSRVIGLPEGEACHVSCTQKFKNTLLSYLPVVVMEFANSLGLNGLEKIVPASFFDTVVPPPSDNEAEIFAEAENAEESGSDEEEDDIDID